LKTFLWRHIDRILIAAGFVLLMVILGATIRNLTRMYTSRSLKKCASPAAHSRPSTRSTPA